MSDGNVTSGARLISHGRRPSDVLLIVIACLAVAAGGLSASTAEAGPTTLATTTNCLVGTGTPVAAATTPDGPGCQSPSAALPTNVPRPVAGQPGARPTREAPPAAESEANLASAAVTPLTSGVQELYWYSLVTSHENCWQAGEPKESSYACDSVGSSYLPSHLVEGALDGDVALTRSGDYCNYYTIGQGLDTTDANKESEYTGYEPPSPLASYQEANHYRSVCQAHETFWGHEVRGANGDECTGISAPCGMQHYVSLSEQKLNDLPWSSSLGRPILIISTEADPYSYTTGTHFGAWGYVCPLFEDDTTGNILEFCMEEWRAGKGEPGTEEHFDVTAACASADGHFADQTITQFALGTAFATEKAGSTNTFAFTGKSGGWKHFIAGITKGNLETAINTTNSTCKETYSTNPANYALIGIEDGTEGGGYGELGASEGNLQLWTEYTELRPTTTTEAATSVDQTGATLNGSVNPNVTATRYYFQYGTSASYGHTIPAEPGELIGSGSAPIHVSDSLSNLRPGTLYHFRVVGTNAAGTEYGADKEVRTPGSVRSIFYNGGGSLEKSAWSGKEWEYAPLGHGITGSPSAGTDAAGELFVFYNGGGSLEESFWNGTGWGYAPIGHAISGNPAVAVNAAGDEYVFYNGGGSLEESAWNGKEWEYVPLGHAITGNPSVGLDAANHLHVFYNGGGSLEYSGWSGKEWEYVPLHHAITGSPAVGVNAAGDEWVFYNGGGSLEESFWTGGTEWGYAPLHHAIVGSPAVAVGSAGEVYVVYNGGGSLEESLWNGKEWEYIPLHHAITGSPSIVINPYTREQWIYYNGGSSLEQSSWNGKEWEYAPLGHAITGDPAAVANTGNVE
jgi:hypothetical protein